MSQLFAFIYIYLKIFTLVKYDDMLRYISRKSKTVDVSLLLIRLIAGGFMLTHGWGKMLKLINGNFEFLDPLNIGNEASLILVVFSEILCAFLVLIGLLSRWVTIPLIITMLVAVFVVHIDHGFAKQEMGLMYLVNYIVILLCGPGRYSIDGILHHKKRSFF